jgi:hypothetical protein
MDKVEQGLRLLEAHRKASAAYHERQREKKKAEGTYKGPGRPKKIKVEVDEKV